MGSCVIDEDEPVSVVLLVRLDDEVLVDCVVEVDELPWPVVVGFEDVDEFGNGVAVVDGVCFSVVANVGGLVGVAGVTLVDSGFCVGVDSVIGDG